MTHEQHQLQLMRDVLRFVPDEHQREAGETLFKLVADVRNETVVERHLQSIIPIIKRVSE